MHPNSMLLSAEIPLCLQFYQLEAPYGHMGPNSGLSSSTVSKDQIQTQSTFLLEIFN